MEKSLDSPRFNLFAPGCTLVVSQFIRLASSCALVGSGLILVITNLILGRTSSILGRTRSILVGFRFFLAAALVSSDSRKWVFSQIFNDRRKSGTLKIFVKKVKNYFFLKRPKIMFSEKKFFPPFWRNQRALGLKIFVKKVKNPKIIIFFWNAQKSCFQKEKKFSPFQRKLSECKRWKIIFFWIHGFWAFQKKTIL